MRKISVRRNFLFLALFISGGIILSCSPKGKLNVESPGYDLKSKLAFLASDSLKGRKPGTPEADVAAVFIRDYFKSIGLSLSADNGLQYVPLVTGVSLGTKNSLKIDGISQEIAKDFTPLAFSGNLSVKSSAVFAGYGFNIKNDTFSWEDYKDVDVNGKWVILLKGDPEYNNNNSFFAPFSDDRQKVLIAKDKGAAGVIFVAGAMAEKEDVLPGLVYDQSPADAGIPVLQITRSAADKMLKGNTIEQREIHFSKTKGPESEVLSVEIEASADVQLRKVPSPNVIAVLPGNDPLLKEQYILIGAHYDHLGMGGPGTNSRYDSIAVHNGADDNASGVAAMMELAAWMVKDKMNKRSVIFTAFTGEEMGLLGSKYFVKHCPFPLKNITAMLNFDMVGRLDTIDGSIVVSGTGTAKEFDSILPLIENRKYDFTLPQVKKNPEGFGPSDHAAFYAEDIPVLYFTTGIHSDYHTPFDDPEKINYRGIEIVLNYVYSLANSLANLPQPLTFRESGPKTQTSQSRKYKVTLGIMPDFASSDTKGLLVSGVRKDGPADRAGMIKGDIITAVDGKTVTNIYDYMARLSSLQAGQTVIVDVIRKEQKMVLLIQL